MVTFKNAGRLGNVCFETATALAYAWRNNLEFSMPTTARPGNPVYFPHWVNPRYDPSLPQVMVVEQSHAWQPLAFNEEWREKNIVLEGYWQTEKYFKDFRAEILAAFGYEWRPQPGVVSVHVRRGDYLRLPKKHPPVPAEWILGAMALFPGRKFLFFSDDIPWCKKTFSRRADCSFSEGLNEEQDLIRMSWCEHHICSCSTFSWWGAWMNRNPDKRIVMPKLWFVPGWGGLDVSDIVPKEWERI